MLDFGSGLAPFLFRIYLAPIFIQAGYNKLTNFEATASWFGNYEWGLGLPCPEFFVILAGGSEVLCGVLLIPGLVTRIAVIPLIITMLVAIFSVHWDNGWLAIADANSWLANQRVQDSVEQRSAINSILREHGNYPWLTRNGAVTILNNGVEFAATYFLILLSLLFSGGGRYTSVDYFLGEFLKRRK